ncbi:helix-turn-helix domain-containing protein [Glaesserella parasuis]|uniref:helix-turn-helix transcriptional regulator n=1 Tax=Glaesserella parasuis TaxID=738 RepID=UPI001924B053|nr:helix-turn-helix domain-containing protein [Glaesserella parasuis]MDG6280642.1 helix-turn-helix domain-containing protein [Glaesserella parasuis]MDG6334035.1 helix-turn-helix domain-containing protein [Glaesserella parasuis]MDG6480484.1 helix-turn-helix domain-containing protein [Glaesserella parasuis]MDG6828391.1 helix-turn-helix domain-containing protein [Glaesserella parasuis]MDO9649518.1 helix-turn-helix domain-containing protein [Glaesserella parasuis]
MKQIQNQTTTEAVEKRYSMAELRALSGVSHAFIYRHIKNGKLAQPEKWGRSSRWKESDVKAWLASFQQ